MVPTCIHTTAQQTNIQHAKDIGDGVLALGSRPHSTSGGLTLGRDACDGTSNLRLIPPARLRAAAWNGRSLIVCKEAHICSAGTKDCLTRCCCLLPHKDH